MTCVQKNGGQLIWTGGSSNLQEADLQRDREDDNPYANLDLDD